jgi:hypothetical protein
VALSRRDLGMKRFGGKEQGKVKCTAYDNYWSEKFQDHHLLRSLKWATVRLAVIVDNCSSLVSSAI